MFTQISHTNWCGLRIASLAFFTVLMASIAQAAAPADRLLPLVQETSAQFDLAYRSRPSEGKQRQEQLAAVINAWRSAPRSAANNEQLKTWLRAAIRNSMPGSRESLPPVPKFALASEPQTPATHAKVKTSEPTPAKTPASEPTQAKAPAVGATPVSASTTTASKNAAADPFRDDPADSQQ